MALTLEPGLSQGLIVKFIDEMVVLHDLKNVTTSNNVQEDKVNIKISNPQMLSNVIGQINKQGLNVKVNNPADSIIVLD